MSTEPSGECPEGRGDHPTLSRRPRSVEPDIPAPGTAGSAALDQRSLLTARYAEGSAIYARLWAPVIGRITRRLIAAMPLADARCVVDIGTGTGYLLPHLREAAPRARIVGIDLTFGMVRRALATEGTSVAVMDARRLALRGSSADAVLAAFMLFHLPEPREGLLEIARILRPGAWVGVTTWATRQLPPAQQRADDLLDREGIPPDQPTGRDSYHLLDTPDKVLTLLQAAGFVNGRSWVEPLGHRWQPDQLAASLTERGSFSRRLAQSGPDRRETLAARARAIIAAAPPDDLIDSSEVVIAVACRPPT